MQLRAVGPPHAALVGSPFPVVTPVHRAMQVSGATRLDKHDDWMGNRREKDGSLSDGGALRAVVSRCVCIVAAEAACLLNVLHHARYCDEGSTSKEV